MTYLDPQFIRDQVHRVKDPIALISHGVIFKHITDSRRARGIESPTRPAHQMTCLNLAYLWITRSINYRYKISQVHVARLKRQIHVREAYRSINACTSVW
jgi:hypothetical protein